MDRNPNLKSALFLAGMILLSAAMLFVAWAF
jgi:hypothetical protein